MSFIHQLRSDYDALKLRDLAKKHKGISQKRLFVLAELYEKEKAIDIEVMHKVSYPTLKNWVVAFNADGPAALTSRRVQRVYENFDSDIYIVRDNVRRFKVQPIIRLFEMELPRKVAYQFYSQKPFYDSIPDYVNYLKGIDEEEMPVFVSYVRARGGISNRVFGRINGTVLRYHRLFNTLLKGSPSLDTRLVDLEYRFVDKKHLKQLTVRQFFSLIFQIGPEVPVEGFVYSLIRTRGWKGENFLHALFSTLGLFKMWEQYKAEGGYDDLSFLQETKQASDIIDLFSDLFSFSRGFRVRSSALTVKHPFAMRKSVMNVYKYAVIKEDIVAYRTQEVMEIRPTKLELYFNTFTTTAFEPAFLDAIRMYLLQGSIPLAKDFPMSHGFSIARFKDLMLDFINKTVQARLSVKFKAYSRQEDEG